MVDRIAEKNCGQLNSKASCADCPVYGKTVATMEGRADHSLVSLKESCPPGIVMQAVPSKVDGWRWTARAAKAARKA